MIENLTFGEALSIMKKGGKVKRIRWKTRYIYISQYKDFEPTLGFNKFIVQADEEFVPYTPNHDDLLSEDWVLLD